MISKPSSPEADLIIGDNWIDLNEDEFAAQGAAQ